MGDSSYKKRKKAEWEAAGLCPRCGRTKVPEAKNCTTCVKRDKARGPHYHDDREKPRVDGNWLFA